MSSTILGQPMSIIDKIFKKQAKAKAITRPKNILVLSDFLTAPTGVARQTLRMVQKLEATGRYKFICLGAIASQEAIPEEPIAFSDNVTLLPYKSYGDVDKLRNILDTYLVDAIWFMTDPRFYTWLPEALDTIAKDYPVIAKIPLVYYHVWDNYPAPVNNKPLYDRVSHIACISKLTYKCMETLGYVDKISYIPHTVDLTKFGQISDENKEEAKKSLFGDEDTFIFFWNGKNMARKQPELMLSIFAQFKKQIEDEIKEAEESGQTIAVRRPVLLMKTSVTNGVSNLYDVMSLLGLTEHDVKILDKEMSEDALILLYNIADVTCNTSFAEGFGLPVLESLACHTPVIAPLTGGIPEQILGKDGPNGQAVQVAAQCIVASQDAIALYHDFVSSRDYLAAMWDLYNAQDNMLKEAGNAGREHIEENFAEAHLDKWDEIFTKVIGF